ncbi:VPS10 domain-containing receptor SorCS2 [Pteropus alecto]|uniref:VPS10 domain-containing receptor SorCS2 n=1 Tax=Pteropus alecto TaxID=9402 RepID=L5K5A3_PTEAL|nr:VPS10 domain-containing receptor SorCS2 [Pteropus alecto]
MLVSSSLGDRDQSLFVSTDEGATFQKQLVPFSVETLIFHPQEEDKALAYTKESKMPPPPLANRLPTRPQIALSPALSLLLHRVVIWGHSLDSESLNAVVSLLTLSKPHKAPGIKRK